MAFRPYDLCLACATHTVTGCAPVKVEIFASDGTLQQELSNF
jgi:F420-non-reducing hydrogenase large subunit